jgi:hypothetical protein
VPWRHVAFVAASGLCVAILALFAAVAVRLGYKALTGPPPSDNALKAMWGFAGGAVAAGVTLTGLWFTRAQADRTDQRLALDTTVNSLKLLAAGEGEGYAPHGVVAGAIATLVHLHHPVIAMRALGACWNDGAVDVPSATWLISEIFVLGDEQAQLEAAAMLDAHAHELCADTPGTFSWPAAIEYSWPRMAPLPARLRVLRAVLRVLPSKDRSWWRDGGRDGWAAWLLREAMRHDDDPHIREHAALYIETLLEASTLTVIQTYDDWMAVDDLRREAAAADKPATRIIMLGESEDALTRWV